MNSEYDPIFNRISVVCIFLLSMLCNNLYPQSHLPQKGRNTGLIFQKTGTQSPVAANGAKLNKTSSTTPGFSYGLQDGNVKEFIESTNYKIYRKYSIELDVVKDTVLSNGLTYKKIKWATLANCKPDTLYYEYERIDEDGNVHTFYNKEDKLLYVFNLDSGAVYNSGYPGLKWRIADKYNATGYGQDLKGVDFELIDSASYVWEKVTVIEKFGLISYDRTERITYKRTKGEYWGAVLGKEKFGDVLAILNDTDMREFYPLKPGNMWKYEQEVLGWKDTEIRNCIYDTVFSDKNTFSRIASKYYKAKYFQNADSSYERIDSLGNIYRGYRDTGISRSFKISACVGDTFHLNNLIFRIDDKYSYEHYLLKKNTVDLVVSLIEFPAVSETYFTKGIGITGNVAEGTNIGPTVLAGFVLDGLSYGDTASVTTSVEENSAAVKDYKLSQNYPNPFNPATTISYSIAKASYVELKVYDMLGREIQTLVSKEQTTGAYKVHFNASGLPSGVYIYSIRAGEFRDSRKLLLLK